MAVAVAHGAEAAELRRAWHRSGQRRRLVSLLLVAPLFLYVLLTFMLPIGLVLYRAFENPELIEAFPETASTLSGWDGGEGLPPDPVFATFARELADAPKRATAEAARRLNYEISGFRTLISSSARKIDSIEPAEPSAMRDALIELDARWGEPAYWHAMKRATPSYTPYYILAAVDLRQDDRGDVVQAPEDQRTYVDILLRTLRIAAVVTLVCLLLGFPLANLMANASGPFAVVLMIAVMLPFWTSLLARTSAWIVLLQKEGLVNSLLAWLGLIQAPLELIFNTTGLYIVMVHMMLPFMVLPLYATMKGIPPHFMKASASLGAHPLRGFLHVYLPMTLPGVGAGALLTFIVTVGYYITPSLVASASDQMVGYFIAFFANTTINWGMASALGMVLLACVVVLYLIAARMVGIRQLAGLK
ncbi:ABC transporter permease [Geminicoccus harenae]|uniref:ABC transporter permease n=2 Tax=Geminicoccus harenae TaxID=2498453 RepID=UPI001C98BF54|nr:ABC transporter permease [Geminicoccus harenae]